MKRALKAYTISVFSSAKLKVIDLTVTDLKGE